MEDYASLEPDVGGPSDSPTQNAGEVGVPPVGRTVGPTLMNKKPTNSKGRECYHCHEWVAEGKPHDCWTTTEAALTRELPEQLMDAWERLRETATEFGEQRVYASHKSIMFSRKTCYFFVRPKKKVLEVWFFLGRKLQAPKVRKTMQSSKVKVAHLVHVTHRDEVEPPLTAWLKEAFDASELLTAKRPIPSRTKK